MIRQSQRYIGAVVWNHLESLVTIATGLFINQLFDALYRVKNVLIYANFFCNCIPDNLVNSCITTV